MANNRMYIRCRKCGHAYMLAKHMACPWGVNSDVDRDSLGEFLAEHSYCVEDFNYRQMYYFEPHLEPEWTQREPCLAHFDIAYEDDERDSQIQSVRDEQVANIYLKILELSQVYMDLRKVPMPKGTEGAFSTIYEVLRDEQQRLTENMAQVASDWGEILNRIKDEPCFSRFELKGYYIG